MYDGTSPPSSFIWQERFNSVKRMRTLCLERSYRRELQLRALALRLRSSN